MVINWHGRIYIYIHLWEITLYEPLSLALAVSEHGDLPPNQSLNYREMVEKTSAIGAHNFQTMMIRIGSYFGRMVGSVSQTCN